MSALSEYLREHLIGADCAVERLRDVINLHHSDSGVGGLDVLLAEVEADRDTLATILRRIHGGPAEERFRPAASSARGGGRLSSAVERLVSMAYLREIEQVALNILRTLMLWRVLAVVAEYDAHLQIVNFDRLAERAFDQYQRLERRRLDLARAMFHPIAREPAGSPL